VFVVTDVVDLVVAAVAAVVVVVVDAVVVVVAAAIVVVAVVATTVAAAATMGTSDFFSKKFQRFFIRFCSPQKSKTPFLTWTVIDVLIYSILKRMLLLLRFRENVRK
jgi:hypothetical protein